MGKRKDNTNEVKLFHFTSSFSLFPSLLFSLIEACSGITVLIELAHHHLYYINVCKTVV